MKNQYLRLISWNVAHRDACHHQVKALTSREPDIVALQEITAKTAPVLGERLREAGLRFWKDSFQLAPNHAVLTGPRRYGELIASRWPVATLPPREFGIPWPERVLSVVIETPLWGDIEFHNTYVPQGAGNGWIKVRTLEGIYRRLARNTRRPRVLCGDFNAPQEERLNGEIVTWGQDITSDGRVVLWKSWRGGRGKRWDRAERNILDGLRDFDLRDIYRLLNGYRAEDFSWYDVKKARKKGRRFDHIFASVGLNSIECSYLHSFREKRLSDHSAMEARFAPQTN